jgi:hypothetical protein
MYAWMLHLVNSGIVPCLPLHVKLRDFFLLLLSPVEMFTFFFIRKSYVLDVLLNRPYSGGLWCNRYCINPMVRNTSILCRTLTVQKDEGIPSNLTWLISVSCNLSSPAVYSKAAYSWPIVLACEVWKIEILPEFKKSLSISEEYHLLECNAV